MDPRVTFSALQLGASAFRDVVGGVTAEAAPGAAAQAAVGGAALAAPLRRVVEGLGAGVHTAASVQVALQPELICNTEVNGSLF